MGKKNKGKKPPLRSLPPMPPGQPGMQPPMQQQKQFRFSQCGACPNCGCPIFIKNKSFNPVEKEEDLKTPTLEDLVFVCPCVRILHARANDGSLRTDPVVPVVSRH